MQHNLLRYLKKFHKLKMTEILRERLMRDFVKKVTSS